MHLRVSKLGLAGVAVVLVLAGIGLGGILSPLVGTAVASVTQIVGIADAVNGNNAKVDSSGALKVVASNPRTNPLPVRDVGGNGVFQRSRELSIPNGNLGTEVAAFTVPSLYRLRLDSFSVKVSVPTGQRPSIAFNTLIGGNRTYFYPALQFQGATSNATDEYKFAGPVPAYAEPGAITVSLTRKAENLTGVVTATVTISGELLPM